MKAAQTSSAPVSPARSAAFDILLRVERESSYASELLHAPAYSILSRLDHSLATELVMGVLRWRSFLDSEIALYSSQPLAKLDIEILIALRLGLYQLLYLARIPVHAAINESVELVKRSRKRSAAAFVNAVLRRISAASLSLPAVSGSSCEASRRQHGSSAVDGRALVPSLRPGRDGADMPKQPVSTRHCNPVAPA